MSLCTVSQKKKHDYIFYNNLNNKCPITIIFGTLISQIMHTQSHYEYVYYAALKDCFISHLSI